MLRLWSCCRGKGGKKRPEQRERSKTSASINSRGSVVIAVCLGAGMFNIKHLRNWWYIKWHTSEGTAAFSRFYFLLSETCQLAPMSSPFPPAKAPCSVLKSSTCSHRGPVNSIGIKGVTGFGKLFRLLDFKKGSSLKTCLIHCIYLSTEMPRTAMGSVTLTGTLLPELTWHPLLCSLLWG